MELRERGEQRGEFAGREAVLGLFVAELDLDQDGKLLAQGCGGGVEALGDLQGVDGVDGVEEFGGVGGLVGLQRADEVELCIGQVVDVRRFLLELLDAVFAEEALAGGVGFEDHLGGMHLADGHQGDFALGAVGAAAGFGNLFVQVGEVFGDGHCSLHLIVLNLR